MGLSSASGSVNDLNASNNVTSLFKRKEIIGRGKFGVVYKAYHVKTQQLYAIKVLNFDNSEDEVEDIRKEIQFLSSLKRTPNITHYYGSYLNDTKLWVIMEYCAGGSLRTLLRPGIIEEKYIGVIMREVLIALISIHGDNVIHRDIKAANILISNNGSVKLCDFGVAAQLSQSMLKRQTMAGTPYWMAPEVIMEGVYYDTRVDIWSLGITAYEIATGNPPYCHMEAIRAMQMITKSKPPRLEGREYSQPLKEFIALCLDEDPKERPSAEELIKSKLIKQEKGTSITILRELITRYLLFREKNEQYRHEEESASHSKQNHNISLEGNGSQDEISSITAQRDNDEIDIKWDFDSLSSKEYILENDINVGAIPEEADWAKYPNNEVNYAYPEEEYYNSNKPNFPYYQGSTIGRTFNNPGTAQMSTIQANGTLNNNNNSNSTMNIPTNQHNSHFAKHYQNTATGTANNLNRNTGTNTHGTSKRSETKASKQLLQLFEDKAEEVYDFPKLNKTMSSYNMQPNGTTHIDDNDSRPEIRNYHSQSTPALSILQTNFKSNIGGPNSTSVLPTPIEIEIPEELPAIKEPVLTIPTKPRSSTVSALTQKVTPILQRRPTISGQPSSQLTSQRPEPYTTTVVNNNIKGPAGANEDDSNSAGAGVSSFTNKGFFSSSNTNPRSPSPTRGMAGVSPDRKMLDPSIYLPNTANNTPPVMKQLQHTNDILLQSMNTPMEKKEKDNEPSRINRDFKKQHPHLKLQMPSPTTLVSSNKLLDSTSQLDDSQQATSQNPQQQNSGSNSATSSGAAQTVNQFGINTSNAQISVAMTPVGEKRFADLTKPRIRSTSVTANTGPGATGNGTSRNNSITNDPSGAGNAFSYANGATEPVSLANVGAATVGASSNQIPTSNPSSAVLSANPETLLIGAATRDTGSSLQLVMDPPPKSLSMDMFIDVHDGQRTDQKPSVLSELDMLLKLFEDGLSVMEHTLRNSLPQDTDD